MMFEKQIYFRENALRGYCHVKVRLVRKAKNKVLRSIKEIKEKGSYTPAAILITAFAVLVALIILVDIYIKMHHNVIQ
ncbi:hypothetical protein GCM10027284_08840 [Cyclobacterium sediminis]